MDWFNKDMRREIFLGETRTGHAKFVMLMDEDDKSSTIKPGDKEIPEFEDKFTAEQV